MTEATEAVPDLWREIGAVAMAMYAGATWDWTQTHLDEAAARGAGFDQPIVDGQMLGAFLALHALRAVPDRSGARIVAMNFRHSAPVYRDDRIRIHGEMVKLSPMSCIIRQDIDVVDSSDTPVRRAIRGAETALRFNR